MFTGLAVQWESGYQIIRNLDFKSSLSFLACLSFMSILTVDEPSLTSTHIVPVAKSSAMWMYASGVMYEMLARVDITLLAAAGRPHRQSWRLRLLPGRCR